MLAPLLTSVIPTIGKVQNIFYEIMTRMSLKYRLQEGGMNEKGISRTPNDSIVNLVLLRLRSLKMFVSFCDLGTNLMPIMISYLKGLRNLTESECSSKIPL
jgi:hypothetical protein